MVTIRAMIFALAAAGAASAQEIDVEAGKNLFLNSCWQCHGIGLRFKLGEGSIL
jgi:mono/diheme cytochrome c family protein